MAGDVERIGLALVGALVGDGGRGRTAVGDIEREVLADHHARARRGGGRDGVHHRCHACGGRVLEHLRAAQ